MRLSHAFLTTALVSLCACGSDDEGDPETGKISGTVTADGTALVGATVSLDSKSVQTGPDGSYTFDGVKVGSATVAAQAHWYDGAEKLVDVAAGETATADFVLEVAALDVTTADANLYQAYSSSFDWTSDAVSLSLVTQPTQGALELAIYHRNPALYANPSGESQVTPSTLPAMGTGSSFDFVVSGTSDQALDQSNIFNDLASTGIDNAAIDNVFHWEPAIDFLLDWNFTDATPLYVAGLAVRAQKWGGSSILPTQRIERAYLHNDELWVEIVFEGFVDLDASITDSNGDGYREVFAPIAANHIGAAVLTQLNSYATATKTTLELGGILERNLDELYSQTNPGLVSATGVPYHHAELGSVEYPFAVIAHAGVGVVNVFLVEP